MKIHGTWLSIFLVTFVGMNAMNETAAMSQKDQEFKAELDSFLSLFNPRTKQIVKIRIERHIKERNEIDENIDVLASIFAVDLLLKSIESQGIIDTKTAGNDPIVITGFTDHAVDRMMNDKFGRKGVALGAIIDALKNPCKIEKGNSEIPQEESARIFWGKQAKVVLSTRKDTLGSIVTVCPVHSDALIKDPSRSGKKQSADSSSIRQQEKKEKKNQRAAMRDIEKMIDNNEISRLLKPVQYKMMAYSSERLKAKKIKNSEDENVLPIGDRVFKTSKKSTYSDTLLNTVSMKMIPIQALVYYKMRSYSHV